MKTLLIILLLISTPVFAEEVELGKIDLTKNQVARLSEAHSDIVKGFLLHGDQVTATTTRPITTSEKNMIIADMKALPDEKLEAEIEKDNVKGSPLNTDESGALDYIDSVDTKTALKELAKTQAFLLKERFR